MKTFNIMPITTPEEDLKAILGNDLMFPDHFDKNPSKSLSPVWEVPDGVKA